jgi:hypothetical protein
MTSVLMVYLLVFVYVMRRVSPEFAEYQAPLHVAWLSSSLIALTTVLLYVIACDPLPPCVGKIRVWLGGFAPQRLTARESPAVDSRRCFPGVMMFCHRPA